jgi:hypothetical protein
MGRPAHKENKVKSTQIIRKTNPESIATYLLIILPVTIFHLETNHHPGAHLPPTAFYPFGPGSLLVQVKVSSTWN